MGPSLTLSFNIDIAHSSKMIGCVSWCMNESLRHEQHDTIVCSSEYRVDATAAVTKTESLSMSKSYVYDMLKRMARSLLVRSSTPNSSCKKKKLKAKRTVSPPEHSIITEKSVNDKSSSPVPSFSSSR